MRKMMAALAFIGLGGGGGETASQDQSGEPSAVASQPAPMGTGTVHEVQMLLTDDGNYRYVPDELTIKVGETVRWINVNGFPHNVAFYEDKIPEGSASTLATLIPAEGKLAPLSSQLFLQPDQQIEITFVGVPTGDYGYYCTPHEPLGMVATLTIEQ